MSSSASSSLPNGSNNSAATKSVTPLVVALTGGPCGGKSSCLTILSDALENVGCKVYRVPETATILLNGGVVFSELTSEQIYDFQKSILQTMMSIETTFRRLAASNARRGIPTVILCDRGAMDPSAYMERDSWLKLLSELELTESGLRDDRYDLVVHLVTAALGAEPFYTTENNNVRSEGIEMARDLDKKVMQAWMGHSYFHIVGNETDFVGKCNRVVQVVLKRYVILLLLFQLETCLFFLHVILTIIFSSFPSFSFLLSSPLITTRLGQRDKRHGNNITKHKYLLKSPPPTVFPVPIREFKVEHIFLSNSNHQSQIRIRKREALDPTTGAVTSMQYSMTLRLPEVDGQRVEKRRNLSGREYEVRILFYYYSLFILL